MDLSMTLIQKIGVQKLGMQGSAQFTRSFRYINAPLSVFQIPGRQQQRAQPHREVQRGPEDLLQARAHAPASRGLQQSPVRLSKILRIK